MEVEVGEKEEKEAEGAASQKIPPAEWRNLSHKQRRSYVNKMRRKFRRMQAAKQRKAEQEALEAEPGYLERVCEEERREAERLRQEEARSMLENAAWLRRELIAQEEFRTRRELQEKRRIEKEERERLIREEWEALQEKEREEARAKEREKEEKEERLKEALSIGDRPPVENQPWHNPMAPEDYNASKNGSSSQDFGTEKDERNCSFFLKTGACRFGDRCSRKHLRLTSSCTLMIPGMYSSLGFQEQALNERDQDVALEYEDKEMYEDFRNFYNDVLPEFSKAGKVVQFKVSRNYEVHLRGNVYVQYLTEEECAKAFQMFNGRWYAQKQLSCVYCPVTKWKSAICGLYNQKRCPKGRNCNFLHVFPNPTGAFYRADRDLPPLSPPPHAPQRSPSSSRHASPSQRRRSSAHHHSRNRRRSHRDSRSKSPPPSSGRRRRRHQRSRTRSKSRERSHRRRRSRSKSKERTYSSRRSRSKSRERTSSQRLRSKSKERTYSSRRSRSKSKERTHSSRRSRSKSRERIRTPRSRSKSKERSRRSRSKSVERFSRRRHHRHQRLSRSSSRDSRSSGTSRNSSGSESSGHQRRHKRKKKRKKKTRKSKKHHRERSREKADSPDDAVKRTEGLQNEENCKNSTAGSGQKNLAGEGVSQVSAVTQTHIEAVEDGTDLTVTEDKADSSPDLTTSSLEGTGTRSWGQDPQAEKGRPIEVVIGLNSIV